MKYIVSFAVDGRAYISVDANNVKEAKEKASQELCDVDFGELEWIDWDAVNAEDEDGNLTDF